MFSHLVPCLGVQHPADTPLQPSVQPGHCDTLFLETQTQTVSIVSLSSTCCIWLLMLLLQTVVTYKSFCTAWDGRHWSSEECRGRGSRYFRSGLQPPAPGLGLGSASIHLTSGGGATILHTQSGQCSGFILGAVDMCFVTLCLGAACCRVRLQRCSWPDVRVTMSPGRCVECSLAAVRGQNMQISGGQSPAGGTTLGRPALGRDTGCQHLVMSTTSTLDREFYPSKV